MLTTATIVGLLLIPIRAKTVGYWLIPTLVDWRGQLPTALMTACYDVAFVAGSTLFFSALLLPQVRRWVLPVTVYRMHLAFSVVTLIDCLSNIRVIPWLGQPFNFQVPFPSLAALLNCEPPSDDVTKYKSREPSNQFLNITDTFLSRTATEGLQHSHTVLSGDL